MHAISRTERVQALVFLVVGLLVIALVCGFLIGVPLLKDTRQYFVRFHESTAGVDEGAAVRYLGVKAGRVKKMTTVYDEVQVELELYPSVRVTESTLARISSAGLIGTYFIELYGTERGSPELSEGAVIRTDPSTMKTLVDKGTKTVERLEALLVNLEKITGPENSAKLTKILDDAAATLTTANQTITAIKPDAERLVKGYADAGEELAKTLAENREPLRALLEESRKAMAEMNRFLESGRLDQVANEASKTLQSMRTDFTQASGSLTKFADDAKIGERLSQVVASLERTEQNLAKLTGVVQGEVLAVSRSELLPALSSFRDAMNTFQELMRVLRDDPSLVIFSKPKSEITVPRPGSK